MLLLFQTHQQRDNSSSTMKNHSNTVPQNETYNSPKTNLKLMEYCDLKFKITARKKLNKIQETQKGSAMSSGIKLMNRRNT